MCSSTDKCSPQKSRPQHNDDPSGQQQWQHRVDLPQPGVVSMSASDLWRLFTDKQARSQEAQQQQISTLLASFTSALTATDPTRVSSRGPTVTPEKRALQKMAEKDPEFPSFNGKISDFLNWLLAVDGQPRKLSDAVAFKCAKIALGGFQRPN